MTAITKNILIGIFVIIAIVIIIFIFLFLHPSVGDNAKTLHVRFTDIDKISEGTRVTYAGNPVGEVVAIKEIPEARIQRMGHEGNIYVYELTLEVDSRVDIYNTDEVTIRTSGLLGEKNIAIIPEPLKPGENLYLINNEIIYATPPPSVEDTLKQLNALSQTLGQVLEGVNGTIDEIKQEDIVVKLSKTIQNVMEITDALNQPDKWNQTLTNLWTLSDRVNRSWSSIDDTLQSFNQLITRAQESWTIVDRTLDNFHTLSNKANQSWATVDDSLREFHSAVSNANQFTNQIKQIIDHVSHGQGTIGHLFVGNDLYLRLKSILHKGQTITDDMSHYGLLFHLNKDWQRQNARRMKLLQRLRTPEQFTTYFNHQLDEVSASLSNVSMILNETACYSQSLLYDPAFTQRFSDLLKKVEVVGDSLNMYNEQIIDQSQEIDQNLEWQKDQ